MICSREKTGYFYLFEVELPLKQARRKKIEQLDAVCYIMAGPQMVHPDQTLPLNVTFQYQGQEVLLALYYGKTQQQCLLLIIGLLCLALLP